MTEARAITFSPVFLDQAFPRTDNELRIVATALGDLQEELELGRVVLIFPEVFESFLDLSLYAWGQSGRCDSWLRDIANYLFQIVNSFPKSVIRISLEPVKNQRPHPIPGGIASLLTDEWALQMADLLARHDAAIAGDRYFIGIASPYKCAGVDAGGYEPPLPARYFPLVSTAAVRGDLLPFITYRCPQNVKSQRLTYRHVRQNYRCIGGLELKDVPGSDHQRLVFATGKWVEFDTGGKRDATLVPDAWTAQICAKLELASDACDGIKAALIEGRPLEEFMKPRLA